MADRIFTSKESEDILNKLQFSTKLDYSSLSRIAFALSLQRDGINVLLSTDYSGKEMKKSSFFGDDELLIKSLIFTAYNKKIENEDELFSRESIIKNHIDSGCKLLYDLFNDANHEELTLFEKIFEIIKRNSANTISDTLYKLILDLGINENTKNPVVIPFNNTIKHMNPHLAIMGKPGGGKTQFLLKILADIRKKSNYTVNFIIFDYKGDIAQNQKFIEIAQTSVYHLPKETLPINPFFLSDYSDNSILISAREKAESFSSIDRHIGPVQKGYLTDIIQQAYQTRIKSDLKYPDFQEVYEIAQDLYDSEKKKKDTLIEKLKDLSEFKLFWSHGSKQKLIEQFHLKTLIIDIHELPILKELVAYLIIEKIYKEMTNLPDSDVVDDYRQIRTILVIDEAHNYLSQNNIFLQKIIREGRSKGIAVFFASQSPNDYNQDAFNYRELLEFSFIFQCDGVTIPAIQNILGCSQKAAKDLQSEIPRLKTFHAVSKPLEENEEITRIEIEPFYKKYPK